MIASSLRELIRATTASKQNLACQKSFRRKKTLLKKNLLQIESVHIHFHKKLIFTTMAIVNIISIIPQFSLVVEDDLSLCEEGKLFQKLYHMQ